MVSETITYKLELCFLHDIIIVIENLDTMDHQNM